MKKMLLIVLCIFLLTGCGNDISCKKIYKDNVEYKVTITADVINGNVTNGKAVMKFNNEKDAKELCNLNKLLSNEKTSIVCAGKMVTINGYEYLEIGESEKTISKDKFEKSLKAQGFKC